MRSRLLGRADQARRHAAGPRLGERECDLARLVRRLAEKEVERTTAEVQPALERAVDANVEPALDALAQELDGHRIDERAGQHRDEREEEHQAQREPRAEHPGLQVPPQPEKLHAYEQHQEHDERAIEHEQEVVAAREELGVRRRGREQEQRDRPEAREDEQEPADATRGYEAAHCGPRLGLALLAPAFMA